MEEVCAVLCYCLLWLYAYKTIYYVCIWRMFVFMHVVVTVLGSVGKFAVYRPLLKIVF